MKNQFFFSIIVFVQLMLAACGDPVTEQEGQQTASMVMKAEGTLLDFRGPTNWEYSAWQPARSTLVSYYAKNIAIDFKPGEVIVNPSSGFTLLAVKDTSNALYFIADDGFLSKLSGNTIKMNFDGSGEHDFGFEFVKLNFIGVTLSALSVNQSSSIFDSLNVTNDLVLSAPIKEKGTVEIIFVTKGFFWTK